MTSANVYYLDFRNIESGEVLHTHRQNAMCKEKYDWDKILSLPLDTTEILVWGHDEEEDYWDNYTESYYTSEEFEEDNYVDEEVELSTLREWIEKTKLVNPELRDRLKEK